MTSHRKHLWCFVWNEEVKACVLSLHVFFCWCCWSHPSLTGKLVGVISLRHLPVRAKYVGILYARLWITWEWFTRAARCGAAYSSSVIDRLREWGAKNMINKDEKCIRIGLMACHKRDFNYFSSEEFQCVTSKDIRN